MNRSCQGGTRGSGQKAGQKRLEMGSRHEATRQRGKLAAWGEVGSVGGGQLGEHGVAEGSDARGKCHIGCARQLGASFPGATT